jgi:hypothetical protein
MSRLLLEYTKWMPALSNAPAEGNPVPGKYWQLYMTILEVRLVLHQP